MWAGLQRLGTSAAGTDGERVRRTNRCPMLDHDAWPTAGVTSAIVCRKYAAKAVAHRRHLGVGGGERGVSLAQSALGKHVEAGPDSAPPASGSGQAEPQGGREDDGGGMELYCTGLPSSWNRDELRQLFEPLGAVTSVIVPQHVSRAHDGLLLKAPPCLRRSLHLPASGDAIPHCSHVFRLRGSGTFSWHDSA